MERALLEKSISLFELNLLDGASRVQRSLYFQY